MNITAAAIPTRNIAIDVSSHTNAANFNGLNGGLAATYSYTRGSPTTTGTIVVTYSGMPTEPFIIGAVLAAIAGVMYASNYGIAQHAMGFIPGLKAFTAAVFGGIGNLAGAVVGGILLGLIEAIGSGYIGELTGGVLGSHYTDIFAFVVLIIMLTLRPSGLLGERVADRA